MLLTQGNGRGASPAGRLPSAPFPCPRPPASSTHRVRQADAHCQPLAGGRPGGAGVPQAEKRRGRLSSPSSLLDPGGYLLSRAVASQVPSAYEGLTSVFGMGTGGSLQPNHRKLRALSLEHPENRVVSVIRFDQALDLLVSVSFTHCCASTPDLSTLSSARGLTTFVWEILS